MAEGWCIDDVDPTDRLHNILVGLFCLRLVPARPLMSNWRSSGADSIVFTVLFGLATLFFLVFGILGLRNVLRFKR
jgi:hypothetical protein